MDSGLGVLNGVEQKALDYLIDEIHWTRSAARILLGIALTSSAGVVAFSTQTAGGDAAKVSVLIAAASIIGFILYVARIHPLKNEAQEMIASRLNGGFRDRFLRAVRAATFEWLG